MKFFCFLLAFISYIYSSVGLSSGSLSYCYACKKECSKREHQSASFQVRRQMHLRQRCLEDIFYRSFGKNIKDISHMTKEKAMEFYVGKNRAELIYETHWHMEQIKKLLNKTCKKKKNDKLHTKACSLVFLTLNDNSIGNKTWAKLQLNKIHQNFSKHIGDIQFNYLMHSDLLPANEWQALPPLVNEIKTEYNAISI